MLNLNTTLFDLVKSRYIDSDEFFIFLFIANQTQEDKKVIANDSLLAVSNFGREKLARITNALNSKGLVIKEALHDKGRFVGNTYQLTAEIQKLITPEAFNGDTNTNK